MIVRRAVLVFALVFLAVDCGEYFKLLVCRYYVQQLKGILKLGYLSCSKCKGLFTRNVCFSFNVQVYGNARKKYLPIVCTMLLFKANIDFELNATLSVNEP